MLRIWNIDLRLNRCLFITLSIIIHYILLAKQMFWPGEHYSNVSVFNKIANCYNL